MWNGPGGHDWWWGLGPLSMLLFWILLVAAIVGLGVWIFGASDKTRRRSSALDILKERYARGEIGKEEFEQKKRDIEN